MRANLIKTNFTAGEISPRLMGRVDIARYANGTKRIENGVVVVQGGVMRRPGTRFAAAAKYGDRRARLIPYVFNRSQAYMLEFGDGYLRIYQNGRQLVNADGTPYEIASPYTSAMLPAVNYVQGADTMFLVHESVKPHRLQRRGQLDWVLAPAPFEVEPFDEIRDTPQKWCRPSVKEFVGSEITLTLSDAEPVKNDDGEYEDSPHTGDGWVAADVGSYIRINEGLVKLTGVTDAQTAKQLDIAIGNARTFQAIQYVSPAEQQAELNRVKPQVNDPDYALKLDAYGKLGALVQKSNATIQSQRDAARFNDALTMGQKLDPSDKAMQNAADATPTAQNFRIADAATHDNIVQQVAQTGIIPSQVTTQLSAISHSRSHDVVRQGAELFNRLYDADPASVGDMPKDMQGFYLTMKQLTDSGMAPDAAVEQAQNVTYNQTDAFKAQLASTQSTKEYKKARSSAMDSAVSSMSQIFRFDPSADDQTPEAVRFRNDYQSLYDINYRTSGGNADVAKKMTNQQISRTWSISEVNGSAQFMKYAPEAIHNYGPAGWQAAQWKEEKERLQYGDRNETITTDPAQLGIPGGAPAIESKTPESRIGGELEITPDMLTSRNGDYAIMVRMKDKDGIESVQPYYDKYGRAMRWKPSLEDWEPYKKMQQESEQRGQDELTRGQDIRGFKDKHRALDEQYQRLHDERIDRVKHYFSWSTD